MPQNARRAAFSGRVDRRQYGAQAPGPTIKSKTTAAFFWAVGGLFLCVLRRVFLKEMFERMKTEQAGMRDRSLGEKIEHLIDNLSSSEVTLVEISDSVGQDGLTFFTIFLALVFLVPVSIPGVSTVFGSAILLIGVARLFKRRLWLPERVAKRAIPAEKLAGVLNRALVWFRRFERISRPYRFHAFAREGKADLVNKLSSILAAVLLMAPFGFIPFSNTLPAVALIFLALGAIQKDGVCVFVGHLSNLATMAYFAALITGGGVTIYEVLQRMVG